MKKEILKIQEFTYDKKKACLNCGEKIADQAHAALEHCPKWYDTDGKPQDCKTKRHTINKKPQKDLERAFIKKQNDFTERINQLLLKKGRVVSVEDLNSYDILLSEALNFSYKSDGTILAEYFHHFIESNPTTQKLNIYING